MTRRRAISLISELDRAAEVKAVELTEEEVEFCNNLIRQLAIEWPPSPGQAKWLTKIHGRIHTVKEREP